SVLYGEHADGRSSSEASIKAIGRDDLVAYYGSTYRPNNATLIVVGSFDKAALKGQLEREFGGWKGGDVSAKDIGMAKPLDKAGIYLVDRPNSAQSVVSIGQVGVDRMNPDYYPLIVMNTTLGRGVTCRVNIN